MIEALINFGSALVVGIICWYLGAWNQRNKYRKESRRKLIRELYPDLVKNLRFSIPDIAISYESGYLLQDGNYLNVLIDMANDSTLNSIEAFDKMLYDDLRSILDDFLQARKAVDTLKEKSRDEIPKKWEKWVEDNYYYLPLLSVSPETFSKTTFDNLYRSLWKNEEALLLQNFERAYDNNFDLESRPSTWTWESVFSEFRKMAEEEWKPIREEYVHLKTDLRDMIEKRILPRMGSTLRSLGE